MACVVPVIRRAGLRDTDKMRWVMWGHMAQLYRLLKGLQVGDTFAAAVATDSSLVRRTKPESNRLLDHNPRR